MPTVFSKAPTSSSPAWASTLPRTADLPRCMLMPWSASRIAASSCVRCSFFASTSAAKVRIQRSTSSYATLMRARSDTIAATSTSVYLCRPSEPGGLDRRIPEPSQLVVQLQQGDRATRHLQRRDVGPDQVARDLDPAQPDRALHHVAGD